MAVAGGADLLVDLEAPLELGLVEGAEGAREAPLLAGRLRGLRRAGGGGAERERQERGRQKRARAAGETFGDGAFQGDRLARMMNY